MGSAVTERCLEALLARRGQCALMANVLTRTSRMLDAARSGDWTLVAAMENKRSQLVKQCFSEPVGAENSELFSEALAIMLHMNEELVALLEAAKEDASVRRTDHQFAHEAIGHYLDTKSESL
ncbi:flagellar protein FliT [Luminiphilus sp.]|nr:flagellar protein FliT [Luminiphilus sp.]MDB2441521.1 flagellar protein FliT [Luminiphilus sp.]